jgi:YesN/AraC family two-component response regulator
MDKMDKLKRLSQYTVLYVEDEPLIRDNIAEILSTFFDKVYLAQNGIEALNLYKSNQIDLIISDISMPKLNGLDLVKQIREKDQDINFILTTAFTDQEYLLDAIELNIIKYVIKPLNSTKLLDALSKFLDKVENPVVKVSESIYFDNKNIELIYDEEKISLTNKESKFITLLSSTNGVVEYSILESGLNDFNITSIGAIHTLVKKLRKKIPVDLIQTVQGIGYKINKDA